MLGELKWENGRLLEMPSGTQVGDIYKLDTAIQIIERVNNYPSLVERAKDMDAAAVWAQFAAAISAGHIADVGEEDGRWVSKVAAIAASHADAMLAEWKKRFSP